jgi:hypothetical protein
MNLKCLAVASVGLLAWSGIAGSQSTANKPDWKVGDSWEFRSVTSPEDKESKWSRQIVELLPEERIRVRFGDGKLEQYDTALNFIPEGRADFTRVLVRYPLKVGDEWSYARKFNNQNWEEKGTAKVAAYETITVPAGTYECYRVEVDASFGAMGSSTQSLWSRWYCPKVKWIAKERLETRVFRRRDPAQMTVQTSELVKFTPGE